jgi:hypothetical protein
MRNYHPYELASLAGCERPDGSFSVGGVFLTHVAAEVAKAIDYCPSDANGEASYEAVDSAIPAAEPVLWLTFVDLAAYQEDDESGRMEEAVRSGDLTQVARVALVQIGERLARALIEEARAGEAVFDGDDHTI